MRTRILKYLAVILIVILAVPTIPAGMVIVNAATKPTLSMSSKTLVGIGATFTLSLKDLDKSKVKRTTYYSQNEKVAIVDAKTGVVTSVGKGTTKIKCKITYKDGKIERPASKLTVKIPATGIEINNANDTVENNNRHVIEIGESYDFNRTLTPSDASDKTYWFIDNEEFATVASNGTVKGLKKGIIRLTAVASLTESGAATSLVKDTINLEIVEKTVGVKEVVLKDTSTLSITFDEPMNSSTILGVNGKLLDNIVITAKTDSKGKTASGFGDLTATLSQDGKTLIIKATKTFNGLYGIHLSSNIKAVDGTAIDDYYENLELYDTEKPRYTSFDVDGTGLKVTINFSEPMDFTNMRIDSVKPTYANTDLSSTTLSMLLQKSNYVQSADKRSLMIDLTNMVVTDHNKFIAVTLSGIFDLSGNWPETYPHTVYIATDTTKKPQAQVTSIKRTGYNTITATFSRAIQLPGMIQINGMEWAQGVVDSTDNTKVNYTISNSSALLSGIQKVSIGYWNSYNVFETDTTSSSLKDYTINFTVDSTIPVIQKSEYSIDSSSGIDVPIITLTFNKKVTLLSDSGNFIASLITLDNNLYGSRVLSYNAIANDNKVTIIVNKDHMIDSGLYTITIPSGFVRDDYLNLNQSSTITIKKDASVASVLPAPKDIKQIDSTTIYIAFDKKLDEVSATRLTNYSIAGVNIGSVELIDNNPSGATVRLRLFENSIYSTTIYPIKIQGIKGYQDSYSEMEQYTINIPLTENIKPTMTSIKCTSPYTIIITFSEQIKGTANFKVFQNNVELISTSLINDRTVMINLQDVPSFNSLLRIEPQNSLITDMAGNAAKLETQITSPVY